MWKIKPRTPKAIHPPFTDFPVALWTASFFFDVASIWVGNAMVKAAFFNIAFGAIVAVLAAVTGVMDYNKVHVSSPARRIGMIHGMLNTVALTLSCVGLWLRSSALDAARTPSNAMLIGAVALGACTIAAYLGGRMVFELGTNVREKTVDASTVTPLRPRIPVNP